jgi:glycine/D-amino acid oxidase-like deaminating enzyme
MDPNGPRAVPATEEARFREFFRQFLPGLANAPLAYTRLCFYCDTFDGDFWIDHDPDRQGLLVCAGGSGHAFKFAPLLGSIIADVLEHKPNRYAHRFAWRQPEQAAGVDKIGGEKNTPRK